MELLVYKASAGSGKTFTLAVEYIRHLIENPRAYRQILAVTFTNKATAEMKERILTQLYGIWQGDPASEAYLKRVSDSLPLPAEELRQRAGTALLYMLHDYSRFRVETIDSFFQSVMRNLARELELAPNLNIELDNTQVLSDAVDSMIENLTATSPVLALLLDYIQERIASDKRWNVANEVKEFGRNIFDEGYMERGEDLRTILRRPEIVKLYRDVLRQAEMEALEQMRGFYDQFEGELEMHGLTADDLSGKSTRGIGSYFRKLRDGKLTDKDVMNATLQKHLESAENWAAKTHPQRNDIIRLAQTSLLPLLQEAEKMRPSRCIRVASSRLSSQHLNKLQLLNNIDQEVRILNREHNRFLLSDTNDLLHRLMREGDSSFVFEKIGTNIRNVMIDEFQDTSRMQWDNFRLLLAEGLSQGADSLIVGDVKQSIYRWRNGDWSILNNLGLQQNGAYPIRVETLKTNRRSEANIIHFNNALFPAMVKQLNARHLDELDEECVPLKQAYADVAQDSPKAERNGYVQVEFLQDEEECSYTECTLQALGETVKELLAQGVRSNDIAILVRKNKNIPPIADYFEKQLHLSIVSDEAFRLDASPAILLLIDALRMLANPDDCIARVSLTTNYRLRRLYRENPDDCLETAAEWHSLFTGTPEATLPADFVSRQEELSLMPLYDLLEELVRLFKLGEMAQQEAYLFAFFDAVAEYLKSNSSDYNLFLRYWEETLAQKTIPCGEVEGIRILSIHKSKGLEFHTVLLPFCDWKLENETNNQLVWCTTQAAPYSSLPLIPVTYSAAMASSVFRPDYLHERLQLWVDNLNLLYVALTRAGKNLFIWSKREQRNTVAELLSVALPQVAAQGEGSWDEEAARFESGTLLPSEQPISPVESALTANRLSQKPTGRPVRMESLMPDIEFRQSNRSADFIAGIDESESAQRFIDRGRILHNLFAAIRTEADVDDAITRLLFEGIIDADSEADVRSLVQKALAQPQVKEWYSGSWRLFNECDIIWQENGVLQVRRPDRVMMRDHEIVVVDFKFGKPNKRYASQVQGYMQLLARMGYAPSSIKGYLWYVTEGLITPVESSSKQLI